MFDFRGYGGTPAAVPLNKINGLTRQPVTKGCELWVEGSSEPFVVTEQYDDVRRRLDETGIMDGNNNA
ncbi:MAG: hypothetical protein K2Y31_14225 [Burkholderiales bacterium]|jgi:hypothetical protein|nr:hypothetical protein [Burkholderiales bacterium]